jgi:threonine dehydratase
MLNKKILNYICANEDKSVLGVANLIKNYILKTPIRRLHWLECIIGYPVYIKLESQQATGSFKYRGAMSKLLRHGHVETFVAASAGNHGLAVADACRVLRRKANICVPLSASPLKKERIIQTGAGLIEYGSSLEKATEHAISLAEENGWTFISPYNDWDIIRGQATLWREFLEEIPDIKNIVVPIGGGGLICGAILAANESNRSDVAIYGCEPQRYASMKTSLERGEITDVLRRSTYADGLATNIEKNAITFDILKNNVKAIVDVSEEDIATSVLSLLYRESLLVEGAGALSVMACLRLHQQGLIDGPIGIIACGGNIHHTSLTRLMYHPIEDELCLRILERRGRLETEMSITRVHDDKVSDFSNKNIGSLQKDLHNFFFVAEKKLLSVQCNLGDYKEYCETEKLVFSPETESLVESILSSTKQTIDQVKGIVSLPCGQEDLIKGETSLRACMQVLSTAQHALNWRSSVYAQSMVPQFFLLGAQESGDVNYERYGHEEVRRIERQMLSIMGLSRDKYACTVVNSGMAAYSLVESYLIRHILQPGDNVVVSPYIYFEADEQLKSINGINVYQAETYRAEDLVILAKAKEAKVVFADPLANTTEQRMVDVSRLLEAYQANADAPCIVIDGSMMPCASRHLIQIFMPSKKLLYIESCSKYLQFGMDMSMAGFIIHDVELKPYFDRLRRNMGLILTEYGASLFPEYDRQKLMNRIQRIETNAAFLASEFVRNPTISASMRVIHPSLPSHPDANIAAALGRYGGCVTFKLSSSPEDHKDQLEALIDLILHEARIHNVPITKGVSFGFSFCRISAASSMAENDPPFLRLSVGDNSPDLNNGIVKVFVAACERMTRQIEKKEADNGYH